MSDNTVGTEVMDPSNPPEPGNGDVHAPPSANTRDEPESNNIEPMDDDLLAFAAPELEQVAPERPKKRARRKHKEPGQPQQGPTVASQMGVEPPVWEPSELDLEDKGWQLHVGGEVRSVGMLDGVYIDAIRARAKGETVAIMSPDGHVLPQEREPFFDMQARRARKFTVELQEGGVKSVLKKGTFDECRVVFEAREKDHAAGTLAFLDPSGGVVAQVLKPMFRTTVYRPDDHIEIDEESYKKYLDVGQAEPAKPTASAKADQEVPTQERSYLDQIRGRQQDPRGDVAPAATSPVPVEFTLANSAGALFEIQVLERIMLREREAMIERAAAGRTLSEQIRWVQQLLAGAKS